MNKKGGWIKIVEAFAAILLITGVLLIVINQGYVGRKDISKKVYDTQVSVLREIELNDQMREEILNVIIPPGDTPQSVSEHIDNRMPSNFKCKSKVCKMEVICALDDFPSEAVGKDIYSQSVVIAATTITYDPMQLKLFCWVG